MARQKTRGVALIVASPDDRLLVLQEFEDKPQYGKHAGMFSMPMETARDGELDQAILDRLVEEELPGMNHDLALQAVPYGLYRIVANVWVRLYAVQTASIALPIEPSTSKREVGNYWWCAPSNTSRLWLRQGAREMFADYLASQMNVVRRRCEPPPHQPLTRFVP